jgi:hypothetical protein
MGVKFKNEARLFPRDWVLGQLVATMVKIETRKKRDHKYAL